MKAKFTLMIMFVLMATSIYAAKQTDGTTRNDERSFMKKQFEMKGKSIGFAPFQQKTGKHKQVNSLKSAQAVKQRLDSYTYVEWNDSTSQWVTDYKEEFTYDGSWRVIQYLDYELDEATGQLVLYWKSDLSYDEKGNGTQEISYILDESTNQLAANRKYNYSYDSNGNNTQEIVYEWDSFSNQFVMSRKYDDTFDAGGNLTQEIKSYFYENQGENKYKTEYKYDNKGKLTQTTSFYMYENTNEWTMQDAEEYTYDSQGNKKLVVVTEHQGFWDGIEQYIKYNKEEYTYDSKSNNTLVLKTDLLGSSNGVAYYGYGKDEYTYDAQRHVTQHLYSRKDVNSQWVVESKEVYVFDDNGNNTQMFDYYNWDEQAKQWNEIYKDEYTYDNRYTENDLILPFGNDNGIFTHMITEMKGFNWDSSSGKWTSDYQASFVYSSQNVTAVNQIDAGLVSVYPNPCSEFVSISFPGNYSQVSFELFDMQGRKLLSKALNSNEKVSMAGLNSGMYIYNLNIDGNLQKGKLVKE